ncbi:MAG: DUF5694 domain-containing protein [Litorimonas sp.]
MKNLFVLLSSAVFLNSCGNDHRLDLRGVDPALTVPPTQVMVLGTAHLSGYSDDLTLGDLEPLLERLEAYAPDIITTEDSSGMTCHRVRAYPREHDGYADGYCFDGEAYRAESGLSIAEGSFLARETLLKWPNTPTASERRRLASYFLASEEPVSALVQWLRLDEKDRVAGDGLGSVSVTFFKNFKQSMNESNSIAARLAARRGLERVHYADDHGSYYYPDGKREAYGARVSELWPQEDDPCQEHFALPDDKLTRGDIIGAYRIFNNADYGIKQMDCDWKLTMNDAEPEAYGRRYTLGWQARNLRMVSMIVTAAAHKPGGKVLSIVGASHKPYFEAYLDQMHDIEVVNTDEVLK